MTEPQPTIPAVRFVLTIWAGFTLLFAALLVLLPLHLEELGFGVDAIGAVVGAAGVGGVLSADPIGRAAGRFGPMPLIRRGLLAMTACVVLIGLSSNLIALLVLHAVIGVGTAAVRVGTQLLVRHAVSDRRRGRVHGAQGSTTRVMTLVVPVTLGLLWDHVVPAVSFLLPAAASVLALLFAGSLLVDDRETRSQQNAATVMPLTRMLRVSSGPILFQATRGGRMLLLPLVGLERDLTPAQIGLLLGVTAAADLITSPISGPVMDARGRLFTIVPSFSLMAVGFVVLGIANGGWLLAIAAAILGVGNGLSSGLLLTLGSDLAPPGNEGPFLGRFGALNDIGRLIGPFLVGFLGRALGLGAAAFALAGVAAAALACVLVFIGETKPAT